MHAIMIIIRLGMTREDGGGRGKSMHNISSLTIILSPKYTLAISCRLTRLLAQCAASPLHGGIRGGCPSGLTLSLTVGTAGTVDMGLLCAMTILLEAPYRVPLGQ